MQNSLRIGRIGALTLYLNYTWLFAILLGLWGLALLWLPDHLPGLQGFWYWVMAVMVLLLYFVSLLIHEGIHTALAKTGPRTAVLYPIGAAQPFRLELVQAGRGVLAALAAPLFNILLGAILVLLTSGIASGNGISDIFKGIFEPLGWINLAVGVINLFPGIPFDGGWALASGIFWFNGDRESGLTLARSAGNFATIALALLGAWRGLSTNSWIDSLALVLIGWSANDAANLTRERSLIRGAYSELHVGDLMTPVRADDRIFAGESVAALVKSHPRFPPGEPIAVLDSVGNLSGVVTLGEAEKILQGDWASTPVRALATTLQEARTLTLSSSLNDAIALVESRPGLADADEKSIPVVQNGTLVGSLNPTRINTLLAVAKQFGVEETLSTGQARSGLLGFLGRVGPPIILVALLTILGSIALRTNPAEIRGSTDPNTEAPIIFSRFVPEDDAVIDAVPFMLSVNISGPSAITTATLTLDGNSLPNTVLTGTSPLTKTLSASVPGLPQGPHNVQVSAALESGRQKKVDWQFRVIVAGAATATASPTAAATPTLQQTPLLPSAPPQFTGYRPTLGEQVLAGSELPVEVTVVSAQPINAATILLDDVALELDIESATSGDGTYILRALVPAIDAGQHRIRVEAGPDGGGAGSTEWTFTAIAPDASNAYFEQTAKFVSEPFLSYWQANGGLALFGYPVSGRISEVDEATGERYVAQYFERARFEQHSGTGNSVILGRLGALVRLADPAAQPAPGATFFPETGHNLSGGFREFWQRNGGLAVFGYPITEEVREVNSIDGKEYTVQYIERNRFEYHPEAEPVNQVQLGLLGVEIYNRLYGQGANP